MGKMASGSDSLTVSGRWPSGITEWTGVFNDPTDSLRSDYLMALVPYLPIICSKCVNQITFFIHWNEEVSPLYRFPIQGPNN